MILTYKRIEAILVKIYNLWWMISYLDIACENVIFRSLIKSFFILNSRHIHHSFILFLSSNTIQIMILDFYLLNKKKLVTITYIYIYIYIGVFFSFYRDKVHWKWFCFVELVRIREWDKLMIVLSFHLFSALLIKVLEKLHIRSCWK